MIQIPGRYAKKENTHKTHSAKQKGNMMLYPYLFKWSFVYLQQASEVARACKQHTTMCMKRALSRTHNEITVCGKIKALSHICTQKSQLGAIVWCVGVCVCVRVC